MPRSRRRVGPRHIRLPVVGEVAWPAFYVGALLLPPTFVVLVWLFFSRVDWPRAVATRALFVSAASVILSLAFASLLLGAVGRAYVRLAAALRTVRRQNLQLRALHQAGLALNEDLDLSSVLARIVGLSRHVLDVADANLTLADDLSPSPGAGAAATDPAPAPYGATRLRVPVRFHDQLLAVLDLSRPGRPFGVEERTTAERFATRAGAAIANARLLDTVRELGGVRERERIARELHDGTVQGLYGLSLEMQAALLDAQGASGVLEPAMRRAVERIGAILLEVRAYVSESAHAERDRTDLEAVLHAAVGPIIAGGEARLLWDWRLAGPLPMPAGAAHELGQVVRESVANAVRHAGCGQIEIAVYARAATLFVEVRDDGRGFDAGDRHTGQGLANMAMRIHILGGDLAVESRPGRGTRVVARLPWAAARAEAARGRALRS